VHSTSVTGGGGYDLGCFVACLLSTWYSGLSACPRLYDDLCTVFLLHHFSPYNASYDDKICLLSELVLLTILESWASL